MAKRKSFPPEYPKQCPCGHKHLSWSADDDHIFCWDCNRKYSFSDCFVSPTATSLGNAPREQLTLFGPEAEPKNSSITHPEKKPNG
jgi:hypothetical protein